ncbi:hypothetical protein BJY04DRAFT_214004 [Aspergillus karnatakaensis]|uniref:cell wall cysteine-rich protein n=1 Tax=Aspergillus karnatakaensis TaxID=1810916 RepID=UPI003CCD01BD
MSARLFVGLRSPNVPRERLQVVARPAGVVANLSPGKIFVPRNVALRSRSVLLGRRLLVKSFYQGCWGCCQPVVETAKEDDVCVTVCQTEKPDCPVGEAPTGAEGCWGCCEPVARTNDDVCLSVCLIEKPECPEGEEPTGSEGCWGCCQATPRSNICTLECRAEKPECLAGEAPTGSEAHWRIDLVKGVVLVALETAADSEM